MRALLIAEAGAVASTRHRVQPLAALLAQRGHEVVIESAVSGAASRARCTTASGKADVVFLQRRLWALLGVASLRRSARRLIFDIDDAVCYADGSRGRFASLARSLKFRALCRAADLVTAGNDHLAQLARVAGARQVEVFPTLVLDHEIAVAASGRAPGDRLRLVWLGGASTRRYLLEILPALVPLLEARACELTVIADLASGPELPGTSYRRFDPARVTGWLRESHVGLAPLPDDPWTRGKCGLKILQYGAAGLPSIAAPVGVQRDLVVAGRTGLLARSGEEWAQAVLALAGDEPSRRALGEQARDLVRSRYSWGCWAGSWAALFERAC